MAQEQSDSVLSWEELEVGGEGTFGVLGEWFSLFGREGGGEL